MLAEVPLFAGLKGKQIKSVASAFARERSYNAGEVIEKEGDSGVARSRSARERRWLQS